MNTQTKDDRLEDAREQAQAQFNTIQKLIQRMEDAPGEERDLIRERLFELPLSVQVRSGWHTPGEGAEPEEYEILLCTGGPAVRIVGALNEYAEPESARLQCQDWFTEWTTVHDAGKESILVDFARQFYFAR